MSQLASDKMGLKSRDLSTLLQLPPMPWALISLKWHYEVFFWGGGMQWLRTWVVESDSLDLDANPIT